MPVHHLASVLLEAFGIGGMEVTIRLGIGFRG